MSSLIHVKSYDRHGNILQVNQQQAIQAVAALILESQ